MYLLLLIKIIVALFLPIFLSILPLFSNPSHYAQPFLSQLNLDVKEQREKAIYVTLDITIASIDVAIFNVRWTIKYSSFIKAQKVIALDTLDNTLPEQKNILGPYSLIYCRC